MLARLNMNEIPPILWKGTTMNQLTTSLQQNQNSTIISKYNLKLAQPLKIYRKEIASVPITSCSHQHISIDELNMPNGYTISTATKQYGINETLDINLTSDSTQKPGSCNAMSTNGVCLNPAQNALNRVRSSGNLKKAYNVNRNNDTYYTSAKQYLESRNRLFAQNQFNYVRKGDLASVPGSPTTYQNVYSPQGLNHCPKVMLTTAVTFEYLWIEPIYYARFFANIYLPQSEIVTIPAGNYNSIDDINQILIQTMTANKHYYINKNTGTKLYLLNISYDNVAQRVVLQTTYINDTILDPTIYTVENAVEGRTYIPPSFDNEGVQIIWTPFFIIDTPEASTLLGFNNGPYPVHDYIITPPTPTPPTSSQATGQFAPQIGPPIYVPLYYKPSNYQYASQGGVSSSDKICRLKYNTITTNALKYRTAFGNATGNALAYHSSGSTYTLKDKIGYPNTCTPIFNKYSDTMQKQTCGKNFITTGTIIHR